MFEKKKTVLVIILFLIFINASSSSYQTSSSSSSSLLPTDTSTKNVTIPFQRKLSPLQIHDGIIKYKIEDDDDDDKHERVIKDAFNIWQKTELGKYITFEEVNKKKQFADIEFKVVDRLGGLTVGQQQAIIIDSTFGDDIPLLHHSEILLAEEYNNENNKSREIDESTMRLVMIHEIGHSLGLLHTKPDWKKLVMNSQLAYTDKLSSCEVNAAIFNNFQNEKNITEYKC